MPLPPFFPFGPHHLQPGAQGRPPPGIGSTGPVPAEGMRLAVEAATSIARLQLFLYEGVLRSTPFGMMLQGQIMIGQMMLASFSGAQQAAARRAVPPAEKK
jgi:hypothetical protein